MRGERRPGADGPHDHDDHDPAAHGAHDDGRPLIRFVVPVVAFMLVPALGGCGDDGGYDDDVQAQFMEQCRAEAAQDPEAFTDPEAFCGCTYERITEEVAFEDFTALDSAFSEFSEGVETTAPTLPSALNSARINCFVDTQGGAASTTTAAPDGSTTTTTTSAP